MTTFTIQVKDQQVLDVLQKLERRMGNLRPVLQSIGDDVVERAKQRFDTSTAPDGSSWAPLSSVTLSQYASGLGKGYRKKNGELNKRGQSALTSRKPLIGESGDLSRQIAATATPESVTILSSPVYAAIHQFGGMAGRGLTVKIPARPFLPVDQNSNLDPGERELILNTLSDYLIQDL